MKGQPAAEEVKERNEEKGHDCHEGDVDCDGGGLSG